jgi:predicted small lipoprotein YifL
MKKLAISLAGIITLAALLVAGCGQGAPLGETPSSPAAEAPVVDSCVTCHTDKALIQQTASTETVEAPEEASGEG